MSDTRIVAKTYIDAGWKVVPLVKGEKRAASSWQKTDYTPADFKPDDGIAGKCGEPSGWRVDVDLDSVEAIAAAKMLLPNTGLIHGRPGKPESHYWFHCPEIRTTQFTDTRDSSGGTSMLVEIRSTSGYTALPPSGHPSGDVLAWVMERDPLTMTADDLYNAVRSVAIAALLARHWPGHGARHSAVGHLAGFLSQGGVDSMTVVQIIKAAATIAGDPDLHDRTNFAQATIAKFRAGEQVTGGPKLADEIGEDVVSKMRGWLRLADLDALEEMNQRHFWTRLGKDDVIGREDDSDGVVFQKVRALYSEYANKKVKVGEDKNGNDKLQPLFPAWLEYKNRRNYRKVTFRPPPLECDPQDYNLWRGFAIEPADGTYPLLSAHLRDIICSGNEEYCSYLIKVLAYTVKYPGKPSEVAVVLRGLPGTGKGIFVRALMDLFGRRHSAHVDRVDQIAGKFNAALSAKIIVFADEAFFAGDKRETQSLKRLITEPTLHVERKGIDGIDEPNHVHLFMATNEEWSVPAQLRERRFFALKVSDAKVGDTDYFDALQHELDNGGLAAFLHDLLAMTVTASELRNVPKTEELRVQQSQSLPMELKWWQECLWDEKLPGDGFGEWVEVSKIFEAYEHWMKGRSGRLLDKLEFGRRMGKLFSSLKSDSRRGARCYLMRGLVDARDEFDKKLGTTTEWPEPEVAPTTIPF